MTGPTIRLTRRSANSTCDAVKALRHIAGVILGAFGVLFAFGLMGLLFRPNSTYPLLAIILGLFIFVIVPLSGAFLLLRSHIAAPSKPCPKCGNTQRQRTVRLQRSRKFWIYHFCGWLLPSLWGASREQEFRCTQCDTAYMTDTRITRITGIMLWVFVLIVLSGMILEVCDAR